MKTPGSTPGPASRSPGFRPHYRVGIALVFLAGLATSTIRCPAQCCPPVIVTQPTSVTTNQGSPVSFWVAVNSGTAVTYQWKFNGANISGATATNYNIGSVQSSNGGNYTVVATNSAGSVTSAIATLTVIAPGTLQISSPGYSLSETTPSLSFNVIRTGGSSGTVTVNYSTSDGTASNGLDYIGVSGTLTFSNAETLKIVTVQVLDDNLAEGDETFTFSLSGATGGASLGPNSNAVVKIIDNDKIAAWGDNSLGQLDVPPFITNVMAIAAGSSHSMALRSNGTVVVWGDNAYGQTNVPPGLSNVVAITAGEAFSAALTSSGTVVAWGDNTWGQLNIPPGLSNVMAISAGLAHMLALKSNGTVVAWGADGDGQTDVPSGLTDVVAVAAGGWHSLALHRDGTVAGWGLGYYGETNFPPDLTNAVAIAAGSTHNVVLRNDGTVIAWGGDYSGQSDVPPGLKAAAVGAGWDHSLVLTPNGNVVCWGDNVYGQTNPPPTLTNVIAIASRGNHSLALTGNGSIVILVQPLSRTAAVGSRVQLSCMAVGSPLCGFRWLRNGTNAGGSALNGATGNVTVAVAPWSSGHPAFIQCPLSPAAAISAGAGWRLAGDPSYSNASNYTRLISGSNAVVEFKGIPGWAPPNHSPLLVAPDSLTVLPATYTFLMTNSFVITNLQAQDAGSYAVVITNAFGSVTSAVAVVSALGAPTLTARALTTTGFVFQVAGVAGTFFIDASPDLTAWSTLTSIVSSTNSFLFTDPAATSLNRRFYRVRQ